METDEPQGYLTLSAILKDYPNLYNRERGRFTSAEDEAYPMHQRVDNEVAHEEKPEHVNWKKEGF